MELEAHIEQVPDESTRLPRAFESLKFRNYRVFWTGQWVSLVGLWMQTIAQSWLAYDITGSKFLLGLINTISGIPILILTPFAGIIADHVNKKNLLLVTQVSFAVISFFIGLLISAGLINYWNLSVLIFLIGIANAIDSPARQAFVVDLVDKKHLSNAIALNSFAFNAARTIGPAAAGYIIGAVGVDACFYLNAASFIAVIAGILMLKGDFSAKIKMETSVLKALAEGALYLRRNQKMLLLLVLVALSSIFVLPYAVLMPVFAKDILKVGPEGLGTLMACSGLGALLGALALAQFHNSIKLRDAVIASTFLMGTSLAAFSISRNLILSCLLLVMIGFGILAQAASVNTYIQHEVPNRLRGRIMSYYVLFFMGFMPIGAFQSGVVSHYIGAPAALSIGAFISLLPAVYMAFFYRK